MCKNLFSLLTLILALLAGSVRGQIFLAPLPFSNQFANASGGATLFGVPLQANTSLQGTLTYVIDGNSSWLDVTVSEGATSSTEDDTGYISSINLSQNVADSTLTLASIGNATPWGGTFQEVLYLPASALQSDAVSTLLYVVGGSKLYPGLAPDQYQTVETIGDGATTAVFGSVAVPEPSTLAFALLGSLGSLLALRVTSGFDFKCPPF